MLWGLPSGKINVTLRGVRTWFLVGIQTHCSENTCCDMHPCLYSEVGWKPLHELGGMMKVRASLVTFFHTAFLSLCVMCLVLLERCLPKSKSQLCGQFFRNPNFGAWLDSNIKLWGADEEVSQNVEGSDWEEEHSMAYLPQKKG